MLSVGAIHFKIGFVVAKRWEGGGGMGGGGGGGGSAQGAVHMAAALAGCRNALVCTGWDTSLLFDKRA